MKQKNNSIEIFRYIASIIIVAAHTHPFMDINYELGYFLTHICTTVGVPFFFAVAGYFYIQKLEKGQKPFWKYAWRLLKIYFIWSCIYYLIDFIRWGRFDFKNFAVSCVYHFFVGGSHYHFWFFPALLFSAAASTLLWRIGGKKLIISVSILLYILGCLSFSYNKIGIQLPVIGKYLVGDSYINVRRALTNGYGFFTEGYVAYLLAKRGIPKKRLNIYLALSILLWCVEVAMTYVNKLAFSYEINIMLYFVLLFILLELAARPMPEAGERAARCRVLANFTYYVHPMCMTLFTYLAAELFGIAMHETALFFSTVIATTLAGLLIYKADNKVLNYLVN